MSITRKIVERVRSRLSGPGAWRAWTGMAILSVLMVYALYTILWKERATINFGELITRVHPADLTLAVLVYSLDLALAIGGWVAVIGMLGGYWNLLDHFRIYVLTSVTRRLPGTFWYLLGRVVLYEPLGVPRGLIALAGGLEFAANIVGGLLVALLAWPLVLSGRGVNPLMLLLPLALGAVLLNPPLVRRIVRRLTARHDVSTVRYRHLLLWVMIFAAAWAVGGVLLYVLIGAVHPLPLSTLPAIIGVWAAAGVAATLFFSFLPFGMGATELTLTALLSPFIPASEALFVAVLMRALLTICELLYAGIGALLSLPTIKRLRAGETTPQPNGPEPQEVAMGDPAYSTKVRPK